jgi:hypothetical protein
MRETQRHPEMEPTPEPTQPSGALPADAIESGQGRPMEREPSQYETAMMIADQLGETEEGPRASIFRIVKAVGRTQARAFLTHTQEIEAQGGMLLPDGSRRRTPGGIFFHLAYTTGITKAGKRLERFFPKDSARPQVSSSPSQDRQPPTSKNIPSPFQWEDRLTVVAEISSAKGKASTVKITLIGTVGNVADKGAFVVAMLQSSKVPSLPKGVPIPSAEATDYVVYIAAKQWKTVALAAKDPEDALIIEGYPQTDAKTTAISVFATSVTSKKLQAAKRPAPVPKQV